jgi:bacillopeptidase F
MPTTQQDFLVPTDVEQGSAAVSYRWRTVRNHPVYGRSYVVERQAGASVSFAFRGHNVTWFTVTGPSQGKAEVSIDGRSKGTFDQYASSIHYKVARTFKGLPSGEHTITVSVLGRPGSAKAKDQLVAVDAFRVGPTVTATPTLDVRWRTARESAASGGSFASSGLTGASATFTFRGTGVDWYTVRGPNQGRAQILVDGELLRTVDGYAPVATYGVVRSITGLPDDVHTLRIVATGTSRAISTGTLVSVDRFVAR